MHALQEDYKAAIDVYTEAQLLCGLRFRSSRHLSSRRSMRSCLRRWESSTCGALAIMYEAPATQLLLRMGENFKAFVGRSVVPAPSSGSLCEDYLGNAVTHAPKNAKTFLAAGSIIQELEQ